MKAWLARVASSTVLRGTGRTRVARWSRWFPRSGPVPNTAFQDADERYPDHWRRSPEAWPPTVTATSAAQSVLQGSIDELPTTWRTVVRERDIEGRRGEDVARELGITVEQHRRILTRARAALRDQVADLVHRGDGE